MAEYPQKPPLKVQMRHIHFGSQITHLEESTKTNRPLNRTLVYADGKLSEGYAWFSFEKVKWFRKQSQEFTAANGGNPLPSLAFFHIPLPEFQEAFSSGHFVGSKKEDVCCPKLNSGIFTAMLESQSVAGAFVGHDHNNDCATSFHGILLAYGRKTGSFSYLDLPCDGGRVIEMEEGKRSFSTWIRTTSGAIESVLHHESWLT